LYSHRAVVVQGPPGTGKTHTIANLLGHFLAEGKNVLINADPNADSLEPKNVKKYPAPKRDKRKVFYSW